YLLLTAHYRESFNFTLDGLQGARSALARLDECLGKLRELAGSAVAAADATLLAAFAAALDDDLNMSAAWGVIFDWVRETNRALAERTLSAERAAAALAAWQRLDTVLGIGTVATAEAPPEILALLDERQAGRKAKDFKRADALRAELKAKGWVIEDTPKGPRLKRV
ncbi:MAG: cysteine--tRNA ligase, partial [Pedosphaera parvula]|nr:cysteine--tRNA ligase [Pedosphaera parvula]